MKTQLTHKLKLIPMLMGLMVGGVAHAQNQPTQIQNPNLQYINPQATATPPDVLKINNNGKVNTVPITSSAVEFLPNNSQPAPPTTISMPPQGGASVSAYGTPMITNSPYTQVGQAQQPPISLPPLPTQIKPTADQAMDEAGLRLGPDQIRLLHKKVDALTKAAAEDSAGLPPKSVTSSITTSLSPGSTPPVFRIYKDYPTSIVVLDNEGNPWPITNWAGGNSKDLEIKRTSPKEDSDGASISITPMTPTGKYTHGGFSIYLKDLSIPLVLTYVGGQPVVDQRVEIRVPARGPNTKAPTKMASIGPGANQSLLSLLDGVAPKSAKPLKVISGVAQAWSIGGNRMLVRTPWTVISPGYFSGMRSGDGTNVYEIEQVSELRALNNGEITSISIDY